MNITNKIVMRFWSSLIDYMWERPGAYLEWSREKLLHLGMLPPFPQLLDYARNTRLLIADKSRFYNIGPRYC
jgi:hypothetical protein